MHATLVRNPYFRRVVARGPPRRLPRPHRASETSSAMRRGSPRSNTAPPTTSGTGSSPTAWPKPKHSSPASCTSLPPAAPVRFSSTPGRPPSPTCGFAKPSTTRSTAPRWRRCSATDSQPACQILPVGLPGYRPYCPYTIDPNPAGTWHGPDLARAERLIASLGHPRDAHHDLEPRRTRPCARRSISGLTP